MRIAIIGGGASGMLASILLKRKNRNFDITIFEKNDRLGKKLLQTGNGMCNLTNVNCNSDHLDNYNNEAIKCILEKYDYCYINKLFNDLGVLTVSDNEGRIYPYSRKASNVLDVLIKNIELLKIKVRLNYECKKVEYKNNKYYIQDDEYDKVILSCGGVASINGEYRALDIINNLKLKRKEYVPSLVALKTKENVKAMSGLRIKGDVSYYLDNTFIEKRYGELLFKDDGISGIVIFELSRNFNKRKNNKVVIDLMKEYSLNEIKEILNKNYELFKSLEDGLLGLFPKMIANDLLKRVRNSKDLISDLAFLIKNYSFEIIETYGFKFAQVSRGGVDLSEVDINTLESVKYSGLYLTGEMLDVDGTCGGFNLHFAWASAVNVCDSINRSIK